MHFIRCGNFSSARTCFHCSNLPDAVSFAELERLRSRCAALEAALRYIVESENDHIIRMGHINAAKDLL